MRECMLAAPAVGQAGFQQIAEHMRACLLATFGPSVYLTSPHSAVIVPFPDSNSTHRLFACTCQMQMQLRLGVIFGTALRDIHSATTCSPPPFTEDIIVYLLLEADNKWDSKQLTFIRKARVAPPSAAASSSATASSSAAPAPAKKPMRLPPLPTDDIFDALYDLCASIHSVNRA
jgi:hypothetical protein